MSVMSMTIASIRGSSACSTTILTAWPCMGKTMLGLGVNRGEIYLGLLVPTCDILGATLVATDSLQEIE